MAMARQESPPQPAAHVACLSAGARPRPSGIGPASSAGPSHKEEVRCDVDPVDPGVDLGDLQGE